MMYLLPALQAVSSPRVLNITGGNKPANIDVDSLQAKKRFRGLMTYTHSKNILESMSIALSKELEPQGISVNTIFPGRASTATTRSLSSKALPGFMKQMFPFFTLYFANDDGKSSKLYNMWSDILRSKWYYRSLFRYKYERETTTSHSL